MFHQVFGTNGSRSLVALLVIGLVLPTEAGAAPPHVRLYKDGKAASKQGEWDAVERMMRLAIEQQPQENGRTLRLRGGYFPHFYSGLARYQRGDCPGALDAFAVSETQGKIIGRNEYARLLELKEDCQRHHQPTLNETVATTAGGSEKTKQEKVRTGQHWVERGADPTRRALQTLERVAPANSKLAQAARAGQGVVDVAESATDLVDLALSPTERLASAIDAYFAGNPKRTLELLSETKVKDSRARAQVHLFRAAANYRLHLLADDEAEYLGAAQKSAQLFQNEEWRKDLPSELFDPRFVRFVRGGGSP